MNPANPWRLTVRTNSRFTLHTCPKFCRQEEFVEGSYRTNEDKILLQQQQQENVFEMQQRCFLQETERALTKKRFQLDAIEGPEEGAGVWTAHQETGAGDG
jgi:hypothetical protein